LKKTALLLALVLAFSTVGIAPGSAATVSNKRYDWFYVRNKTHTTPSAPKYARQLLAAYGGTYAMSKGRKVIYLTMDEGYENGYTPAILDTLKRNKVPVTFFCTASYIKSKGALVRRMYNEGHLVGSHTATHPNMVSKANNWAAYKKELTLTEAAYYAATKKRLSKIVRMPSGIYSARALSYNKALGYKTYFWSFAYADWDPRHQATTAYARKLILANSHNGEILLLHAVSRTNTAVLDSMLKNLKGQGYVFKLLPR
jgi:peptidoglycan-N-acetylmuramic acid deacetylase